MKRPAAEARLAIITKQLPHSLRVGAAVDGGISAPEGGADVEIMASRRSRSRAVSIPHPDTRRSSERRSAVGKKGRQA